MVNVRKICSTVEGMNDCKSSVEQIIEPLKECMATTFLKNKHTTAERITQRMDDFKISCEINTVSLGESGIG